MSSLIIKPSVRNSSFCICCLVDESYMVCHKGYLSLFPFLLELLPPSAPQLGHILDLMRDPEHLWSPYGIRSLSKSHPEFGQGENYWKGPIWIQMNYLALRALHRVCVYPRLMARWTNLTLRGRLTVLNRAHIKKRPKRFTRNCGETWWTTLSRSVPTVWGRGILNSLLALYAGV